MAEYKPEHDKTLESKIPKKEFDISEVFRGANLSNEDVTNIYKESVGNPNEVREKLKSEMDKYKGLQKEVQSLAKNVEYYSTKLNTGFDIREAKFWQKGLYSASKLIPIKSWREGAQEKLASTQQENVIDMIMISMSKINDLTTTVDTLIVNGKKEHGNLRNLADNDYLKQQKTAVNKMNEYVEKIGIYTNDLDKVKEQIETFKDKEANREQYLSLKKERGELEDTLFEAKQELVKATIDYNVSEDCFYQAEVLMDKLKNTVAIMSTKNYEVSKKTEETAKLIPSMMASHDLVEAGEALVTLGDQLTDILRAQAISESEKIKALAQIVATDIETRTYDPVHAIQVEMNEETRKIIEATQAFIVQEAQSGIKEQMYEELKKEVEERQAVEKV